jgi:NAD-dependent SIR2 family protein deacetylase
MKIGRRIILFLGAGASAPFGYPTTQKFINELIAALGSEEEGRFLSYLLSIKGFTDIEHVLELLDLLQNINRHPVKDFLQTHQTLINFKGQSITFLEMLNSMEKLRDRIQSDVFRQYEFNPTTITTITQEYSPLVKMLLTLSNHKEIQIFTTNYDCVIEEFCRANKLTCLDGFKRTGDSEESEWNPEDLNREITDTSETTIKLFKLHGSLNWRIRKSDNAIVKISPEERTRGSRRYEKNLVIYPAEKLKPEIEPFKKLHEFFKTEFIRSDCAIFIGFSFRDEYLNSVIMQGSDRRNQIISVSPHVSELLTGSWIARAHTRLTTIESSFGEANTLNSIEKIILKH